MSKYDATLPLHSIDKEGRNLVIDIRKVQASALFALGLLVLALFVGGCGGKSDEQILADVMQDRSKGHYRSAVVHLKSLLQRSPENAEARYLLGTTYNDIDYPQAAETELRRAIDLGHERAKVAIGRSMLSLRQYQKVIDQVQLNGNLDDAGQADVMTMRARALLGLNRLPEGRELLEQALAKQPEFADALLEQANLAAWEKKPDEAAKLIERALASTPKSVEAWLMKGDLARFNADSAGATAAYKEILQFSPENVSARLNLVLLDIAAGNYDEAQKQLAQIRKLAPDRALVTRYLTALIEFRQKKYPAARDAVLQALKGAPDHLPSLLLAGRVEYALGSHGQAQKHLGRVIERAPRHVYARKLLATSLMKSGQVQRAGDVLQPALDQAPGDGELMGIAGELYLMKNETARAMQYFEKAAKLDPKSASARAGLAVSLLASGQAERALADLEAAVELDAEKYQADVLLVMSHLQRKNLDEALKAVESLEKKQPNNPLTYNLKGAVYLAKKDDAAARKYFERALELNPKFFAAVSNLAQLDLKDNKPAQARRRFEAMLESDKDNADALIALASLAPRIGATAKDATDWLERAHKASPGSVRPKLMLARAYAQLGETKKALEIAQQAQTTHPENPEVLDFLATMQYGTGAKEQALATYGKLVSLQPNSPAALYWLGMAQAATGNFSAAATTLRRALALKPDFAAAQAELVGLELRTGRVAEAMKTAKQVQAQAAKSPLGFVLEGDVLMVEKKFSQAANAYETAYGLGKSPPLVVKLHAALTGAGKPSDAEARLAQGMKEWPDDPLLRAHFAEDSLKRGNYKSAIEQYEWLAQRHPDNALVLNNLAWCYQQVKDARALATAERAYKLQPDNGLIADTLGWMLVEQGNTKRGTELLQKAVAAAPRAYEFRYHLAQALVKAGERAKARQELEKLLADAPASPHARDVKQLLSGLDR